MSELTDKEKGILQGIYALGGSTTIIKGTGFNKLNYSLKIKIALKPYNSFIISWLEERFGGHSLKVSTGFRWTCTNMHDTDKFIKAISDENIRYLLSELQIAELDIAKEFTKIYVDQRPIGDKYELEKAKKRDMKRALYERMIVIRPNG